MKESPVLPTRVASTDQSSQSSSHGTIQEVGPASGAPRDNEPCHSDEEAERDGAEAKNSID